MRASGRRRGHFIPRHEFDIAADGIKIVHAALEGALHWRVPGEGEIAIRTGQPARRACLIGKEQLETFVNAENQRDALQLVPRQRTDLALLPVVIGGPRYIPEQGAPLIDRQAPKFTQAEEQPNGGWGHTLAYLRVAKGIRGQDTRGDRGEVEVSGEAHFMSNHISNI